MLTTLDSRFVYDGDGSTVAFSFPRKFRSASDLQVFLYDEDDDSYALQTLNTHYTVAGAGASNGIYATGTITFVTAPGTDKKVVIFRAPTLTQEFDFQSESDPISALNRRCDLLMMQLQRMQDQLNRSIRLGDGDSATAWTNAVAKADFASAVLGFDEDGEPMAASGVADIAISAAMTPVVQAASLAAGRETLNGGVAWSISSAMAAFVAASTVALGRDVLESIVTPSQITSNQNNYAPTGLSGASVLRLSADDERTITGLEAQPSGRRITLQNVGAYAITLSDDSGSSTAANRFSWPYDVAITLAPGEAIDIRYDGTLSRWTACFTSPVRVADVSASAGAGNYRFTLGADGATSYPDFSVDQGYSRTKTVAKSLLLGDPGDTPEIGMLIVDGTASSPSARAAPYPGFYLYGWPRDDTGTHVASQSPYANTTVYGGRNAQLYFPIIENPTQTARGGAAVIGVTKTSTRTPIDRFWITGQNAAPGFAVFAGRAFEDSGISYPYDPASYDIDGDFSPMTGINWNDYTPPGVGTFLAPDLANGAAIAIRNNTDVDEGFDFKYEHSSNEGFWYRVVNGTATKLARFGRASGFVDLGFGSNSGSAALRAQAISSQVDYVVATGGDGSSNEPKITIDGATTNEDLTVMGKGSGGVQIGAATSTPIVRILSTTASNDFSTISAGGEDRFNVTLTGCETGDVVFVSTVSASLANNALSFWGEVSAADTVRVHCYNHSGSGIDPSSQTVRVVAIKFGS